MARDNDKAARRTKRQSRPKTLSPREYTEVGGGGEEGADKRGRAFGHVVDFPIGPYVSNHPLLSLDSATTAAATNVS